MSTERLTDSLDRGWTPAAALGRGTWGRCRLIRDDAGREAVLKEPLTDGHFPADSPLPDDLVAVCRRAADETAAALRDGEAPFLPRLEATVDLGGGRTGLVLPRYVTLERRLAAGLPLADALRIVGRIAGMLAERNAVHGAIRPGNVLFGERGEIFLADPWPQALQPHTARLLDAAGGRDWLPPEVRPGTRPTAGWDTWALCQILHAALTFVPGSPAGSWTAPSLDKLAVAALKDRAHAKLATEGSNPRFRGRVADRLGTLLSRGLSADAEPSPPFRFATARELAERVNDVLALVRPKVVDVGRLLLPGTASDGVFQGGSDATFTVTVGCTPGISDHEDIVCGLQLVDLDATDGEGRRPVEDARVAVQVHPSGRLRFQLALPGLAPGRYRLRVAFAIKDSGDEPVVATGEFQVRPPPGYVPPPPELPAATAIPFRPKGGPAPASGPAPLAPPAPRAAEDEPLTDPGRDLPPDDDETDPSPHGSAAFPRPVAPPDEEEEEPPSEPEIDPEQRPLLDETPDTAPAPRVVSIAPPQLAEPRTIPVAAPPVPPLQPALRALPEPPPDDGEGGLDTEELLADTEDVERALGGPIGRAAAAAPDADLAPSGVDDLPGFDKPAGPRLPGPVVAAVELLRRDPYLSVGAAVAASLALVLAITLLLKAC